MTFGDFLLDGNVLELAFFAAIFALLAVAFLLGRLEYIRRGVALERSVSALRQVREEEQARLDNLRGEREGVMKEALRAQDSLERWETLRRDHRNLSEMRAELDAFEREESNRIDELERRRAESARRLGEIQSALDLYPPEITGDEAAWAQFLEQRKSDFDELQQATATFQQERDRAEARTRELEDTLGQREQALAEADERLAQAKQNLEAVSAAAETVGGATIQFPEESLNVTVKGMPGNGASNDKLGMFRIMPDCLRAFDKPSEKRSEDRMLQEFEVALSRQGLNYPTQIVRAFHTALKVNDLSPLAVLSGLSGTGKSQLPRAYARFFGIHFLHVPVEPGWDSPQDLLGFYDFVAGRYRPTDRARALGHFDNRFASEIGINGERDWDRRMLIILLDEMNLARTEYYFSEFLSRLEMRGPRVTSDEASRNDSQIAIDLPYSEDERPKHLYVPHNVVWVGTLNEDETTQALSDKVLDRANSIRFAPPEPRTLRKHSTAPKEGVPVADGYLPYERWLKWSDRREIAETQARQIDETIERLAELMQRAGRGFGYRITQSIKAFISRYPGSDWRSPMIDQINMRLLPKLAGAEMSDCYQAVDDLRKLTDEELGNPSFAHALGEAAKHSEVSQIFSWPGYTYEEKAN